ncbi:pyridoxal 5'-phosphate synthase glutaminase subunit PdxT [Gallibacterium trehalosifermentans]|uniref:Pyridoxal 5'-phosphate synthase subunit PdxT n=1 Tax=Gallibacterium trehalosifermentans TaxID=516935 RepID=A0ABV6H0S7_9PAST
MKSLTIGVLALQGAVSEHLAQLQQLGVTAIAVKQIAQLAQLDGIILPGGESTAIGKLMRNYGFIEALQQFATNKAIFGTCAGMILLAKQLVGEEQAHLQLMDIEVQRNAFGRQVDSFQTELHVKGIEQLVPAVFIRAPYIVKVGERVDILASYAEHPVLARQGKLLACSFHPELTSDLSILKLFLQECVAK